METAEILTILLLSICLLGTLAERVRAPSPMIFLLGGVALAFLPMFSSYEIEPQAILTIFLPPLLMGAAFFTSLRDFKINLHPILQLAMGLVVATAAAVAYAFTAMLPGATLATGFVMGAIVSPPDAVAAIAVIRRLRVPRRIVTILEGESLINDASGIILYKFAVAAVMTGSFSLVSAGTHFFWMVICGSGLGLLIGAFVMWLFPRIKELSVEILITFASPYVSYLLAETLGGSGVLAVVATGLYVSWFAPTVFTPKFRIPAEAVWQMVTFLLNALVFMLIGLRIPSLFQHLSVYTTAELVRYSIIICGTCVAVRMVWVFVVGYGTRALFPSIRRKLPRTNWQNFFIVGFTGMRGVVSLATALALPTYISWGMPFPYRDLITFLALVLIVFTLVVQGLMLPWLLKHLSLAFDPNILQENWNVRTTATRRALEKLAEIEGTGKVHSPLLRRIRSYYESRLEVLGDGPNTPLTDDSEMPSSVTHPLVEEANRIWQDALAAEREVVVGMRRAYEIGDDVMHDLLRELDLMANRFAA